LLFWRRPEFAITIDYGQRAAASEVAAAAEVARSVGVAHDIVRVDCSKLGSGDMAGRAASQYAPVSEWWPFRNQLLLTLAGMRALTLGVSELMVGSVSSDGSHVDGRSDFYAAADALMAMQEGGIRVTAPAVEFTTAQLVRMSGASPDLISWAHSCHTGPLACGGCRGCHKHYAVMKELYGKPY
jgi:7-cyano-7-deazaguanine synthase